MHAPPPPPPPPLILLAGMGADERLFAPQRDAFPQLVVPKWIEPRRDDSIASYAARLAAAVDPKGPCFVGGASFGGFVAIEMARHLDARACFLIGSVAAPDQLPLRVRALRCLGGAARVFPFELACRLAGGGAEIFRLLLDTGDAPGAAPVVRRRRRLPPMGVSRGADVAAGPHAARVPDLPHSRRAGSRASRRPHARR